MLINNQNGGYVNPIPRKRALRDPYAGWWDPQERRNFGEPVHEDNDTLGVFSTEPYTHSPPGRAALHLGIFVSAVLGLCAVVAQFYPDRPSVPREFPDGLEAEMGGPRALIVRLSHGSTMSITNTSDRRERMLKKNWPANERTDTTYTSIDSVIIVI